MYGNQENNPLTTTSPSTPCLRPQATSSNPPPLPPRPSRKRPAPASDDPPAMSLDNEPEKNQNTLGKSSLPKWQAKYSFNNTPPSR